MIYLQIGRKNCLTWMLNSQTAGDYSRMRHSMLGDLMVLIQ
uniref:Uncharacterized protein n=1 Tax=Arundo donax TaxID=35708 RepID=A0A0A9EDL7_ARUDO